MPHPCVKVYSLTWWGKSQHWGTLWQWELPGRTPRFLHLRRTGNRKNRKSPQGFLLQQATSSSEALPHGGSTATPNSTTIWESSSHMHDLWGTPHTQTGTVVNQLGGHSLLQGLWEPSEFRKLRFLAIVSEGLQYP